MTLSRLVAVVLTDISTGVPMACPAQPLQFVGDFVRHGAPTRLRFASVIGITLPHGRNTGANMYSPTVCADGSAFLGQKKTAHPCTVSSQISLFGSKTPFRGIWLSISGASAFLILIINEKMFSVKNDFSELVFGDALHHNM